MPPLRPELVPIVDRLLRLDATVLHLDAIAEAIGALPVSWEDIDAVFAALEEQGRVVGDPGAPAPSESLARVLSTARILRAASGRVPNPAEIAEASGLSLSTVRAALLFARVVQ